MAAVLAMVTFLRGRKIATLCWLPFLNVLTIFSSMAPMELEEKFKMCFSRWLPWQPYWISDRPGKITTLGQDHLRIISGKFQLNPTVGT